MPLFEEKLICPLAVRFTQEHIRPIFQDGGELDAIVKTIQTRPGQGGGYDVILEAPFPAIEVVRLRPRTGNDVKDPQDGEVAHWFSLDNRRLYCLQRAAAALWPKRCAVSVEVLYRATDGILKKHNSSTSGRAVGIGHSLKALVDVWDWRKAILGDRARSRAVDAAEEAAHARVEADDTQVEVEGLADAPAPPSMLDLFYQQGVCEEVAVAKGKGHISNASTTASPTPRSGISDGDDDAADTAPAAVRKIVRGMWKGSACETYEVAPFKKDPSQWTVVRREAGAVKKFTLWYDENTDCLWWGVNWSLYANGWELRAHPNEVRWNGGRDTAGRKPRFIWSQP